MNALLLVALCCALGVASAQEQPSWLPVMQPYSCVWCSGRYYRRSPQALTIGRPAVGSVSGQSSDLALHAGLFYDIIPKNPVKNEKSACIYLVNMYRKDQGPVAATEIMSYINMSFFGPQQPKDYSDKPHPLTFQCCHYKFGRQLMDQLNSEQQQDDDVVSTTQEPSDETTVFSTTPGDVDTTTDVVTETPTTKRTLAGRAGLNKKTNKKSSAQKHKTAVKDESSEEEVEQREKRQTDDDDSVVAEGKLKKRNSLRVPVGGKISGSKVVVVDDGDKYKAAMPEILPEGFTCNTLTRQLYMELSQDNETRQRQIQKAMQRNTRYQPLTARGPRFN